MHNYLIVEKFITHELSMEKSTRDFPGTFNATSYVNSAALDYYSSLLDFGESALLQPCDGDARVYDELLEDLEVLGIPEALLVH